ncbi:helix-turn-helix domain-containing protein [Devosia sp. SL43]|uniref:helix-turn-helix domain-containing protein n=1 Tax=Devosia sp. SL43 TaxID=2806348 RepID=UPI001F366E3F|nr:helix-turn-helix domain-containing protein [Devosia sp. SL43]UJW87907.1 helix-turn-helix domain-containing protein [Devosia sp. SL43]
MSKPRYSILPADCLDDPRFKDVHLRVLVKLGSHTDNRGWCEVNQKKLGEAIGKTRETVNRAIRDLCEMGFLMKREQLTKANGRTISQYRVLMDRPDPTPDVETPVKSTSQGVVTPEDHNPCDEATSQHNYLSSNDHPSLRSDNERVSFDEAWKIFPKRPAANRTEGKREWSRLSDPETRRAFVAVQRFDQWRIEDAEARGVTAESQLQFMPGFGKWIRTKAWVDALHIVLKSDPVPPSAHGLVVLKPDHADFQAVEKMLGRKLPVYGSGSRTFRIEEIEQARAMA